MKYLYLLSSMSAHYQLLIYIWYLFLSTFDGPGEIAVFLYRPFYPNDIQDPQLKTICFYSTRL